MRPLYSYVGGALCHVELMDFVDIYVNNSHPGKIQYFIILLEYYISSC